MRQIWPDAPEFTYSYAARAVEKKRLWGPVMRQYMVDVRNFLRGGDDKVMREQLYSIFNGHWGHIPVHDRIKFIQRWVMKHIKYVGDETSWKVGEFWQYPEETLAKRIGDCEDGALLIYSLCACAGVPESDMRIYCGFVKYGPTAQSGGHAYMVYNNGDYLVPVDWCYHPDTDDVSKRRMLLDRSEYRDVWFSFNRSNSWNNSEMSADQITEAIKKGA